MARLIAILVVLLLAAPLGAMDVETSYTRGTDYTSYTSFEWDEHEGRTEEHPLAPDQDLGETVREAIARDLGKKGLSLVSTGEGDLRVVYFGMLEDYLRIEQVRHDLPGRLVYEAPADIPSRDMSSQGWKQGTLIIMLVDNATDETVWKGWATDVARSPQKLRGKAGSAVKKILRQYPPK